MSKPNIVFIYSDQHRGDAVGCAGHPVIKTPHLDRLGSEGVVFSQCYTNGPICMPARLRWRQTILSAGVVSGSTQSL